MDAPACGFNMRATEHNLHVFKLNIMSWLVYAWSIALCVRTYTSPIDVQSHDPPLIETTKEDVIEFPDVLQDTQCKHFYATATHTQYDVHTCRKRAYKKARKVYIDTLSCKKFIFLDKDEKR